MLNVWVMAKKIEEMFGEMKACFLISECSQASQIFFCKDTKYFSFHQIFSQLFSPIPKDLTFPPVPFNISFF